MEAPILEEGLNYWTIEQHEAYMESKGWRDSIKETHRSEFKGIVYADATDMWYSERIEI